MTKTAVLSLFLTVCLAGGARADAPLSDPITDPTNAPINTSINDPINAAPPKTRVPPGSAKKRTAPPRPETRASLEDEPRYGAAQGLVRIKDIADMRGGRGNQLFGYSLVVGLEGTGDGQSVGFTPQSVVNMMRRFGLNITVEQARVKNVAAVMVIADLPAFAKPGSRIDVTVSSIGDAKSLQGGTLSQTVLHAADGKIYAVAQGALSIGGFNFEAGGAKIQKNHVNVGRVPQGAYVEREVPMNLSDGSTMQILLRQPDYTTASRIAAAIRTQMPGIGASATDGGTVTVGIPTVQAKDLISFISRVETVRVTPDVSARIVINERTGTVVMGGNVRLSPGAVAHGSISIQVRNAPIVVPSPPDSFNPPPPLVVQQKDVTVTEHGQQLAAIPATTSIAQLVTALNNLGVTPRDLISILQAMHDAGMIAAEIVEQ